MDERERRVGRNEALFREVNERVRELNEQFATLSGVMKIVCECGDLGCLEMLSIQRDEYERIRRHSTWFVVAPGHEVAGVERIVDHHDAYEVVDKRIDAGEEAIVQDPGRPG